MEFANRQTNRNRRVECDVCGKPMRSDNLKRHKQTHKDLLALPDNEIKKELEKRQEFKKKREEKIRKIGEIAKENGLAVPEEIISRKRGSADETDDVYTRCLQNHQLFLEKVQLGKKVASIVESGDVIYQSLGKTDREAFDTYRKYLKVDITDVVLRKWQEEAMKFFYSPTERQVIWIADTLGGKGKTFFQKYVVGYFGRSRVATLDLRIKHANACNVLKKLPLHQSTYFFLTTFDLNLVKT